jgi:hypothetical protein
MVENNILQLFIHPVINDFRREVVARLVVIGGIVDPHCLSSLFS